MRWIIGIGVFLLLLVVFRRWIFGDDMKKERPTGVNPNNAASAPLDAHGVLLQLQGEIAETIAAIQNKPKAANLAAAAWLKEEFLWQAISTPDYSFPDQLKYISDVLKGAVEKRHAAVSAGATGRDDPDWASAALVESWSTLLVGVQQGRWNYKQAEVADILAELDAFSRRHVSREDRERIRQHVMRLL